MADSTHSTLRRGLAATIAGLAIAVSAGVVIGGQHASAVVVLPNKTCVGTGTQQEAEPGGVIVCTISAAAILLDGQAVIVQPLAPTGAFIPAGGCQGVSTLSGTAPLTYTTTVAGTGLGATGGSCKFTVHATTLASSPGNNVIGYEEVQIPQSTAVGTSVTQQQEECSPPNPLTMTATCSPAYLPLAISGPGSCVGGAAVPVLGGCSPIPSTSATATPSTSSSPTSSGGSTDTASATSSATAGAVQAAATSTPFTGGPDHPLPVAAALVAAGGALLALLAAAGPSIVRRRHLP